MRPERRLAAGCWESFTVKSANKPLPEKSLTLPRATRRLNPTLPMPSSGRPLSYLEAGVDIDAGDRLVENIKPYARRTLRPEVLAGIGGFGALGGLAQRLCEAVLVAWNCRV